MENKMEIRCFDFAIEARQSEEHGHFIEGRPIVYEDETNLGWCREIIKRGALDKTDLKDVRFLINHNTDMIPLARSRNNTEKSTMQMVVDEDGMRIRVDLDTENNTEAAALYSAVERGDISGMSFMFRINSATWEDLESDCPLRKVEDISRVIEVSAVTFPAYESTVISARGLSLDSGKEELDSLRAEHNLAKAERDRKKAMIKLLCEV